MSEPSKCPRCGNELPADAPDGLCPTCLMAQGIAHDTNPTRPSSSVFPKPDQHVTLSDSSSLDLEQVKAVPEPQGRYTYLGEHGRGGMGRVLLVHDSHLERDIVLKELLPQGGDGSTPTPARHSKDMAARFLREAKITGQLEHPSITPVHELGRREDGTLYYTMKFVRGRTLAAAIRDAKTLDERLKLLPHFVDLCHAVAYAHSRGVIHRDIKPPNVMIGDYGETMIIDWGLAKVKGAKDKSIPQDPSQKTMLGIRATDQHDSGKTQQGQALGTPAYMPPEQAKGELDKIDERSDIYSLGAILFEIITGTAPFTGSSVLETLDKAANAAPPIIASIERFAPLDITKVCQKAMAKDPAQRFQTAKDLAEAAQACKLRRPKSRLRRVLERGSLAAVLMVSAGMLCADRYYDWKVDVAHARIRAAGGMITPNDWRPPRASTTPEFPDTIEFSVTGYLLSLNKNCPRLERGWLLDGKNAVRPKWLLDPSDLTEEQVAKIEAVLAPNRPQLQQYYYAVTRPPDSQDTILRATELRDRGPVAMLLPNLITQKNVATLAVMDGLVLQRQGHDDDALERLRLVLEHSLHLRDEPSVLANMFGIALARIATDHMEGWLPSGAYSKATISAVQETLERAKDRQAFILAMESERMNVVWIYRQLDSGVTSAFGAFGETPFDTDTTLKIGSALYSWPIFRFIRRRDELACLRMHDRSADAAQLPYAQSISALNALNEERNLARRRFFPFANMLQGDVDRLCVSQAACEAREDLAILALALKDFQQDHGVYPDTLDALVPAHLKEIPSDAFTDKPFVYRRDGSGYVMYSFGMDQADDGGDTKKDIVWRANQ